MKIIQFVNDYPIAYLSDRLLFGIHNYKFGSYKDKNFKLENNQTIENEITRWTKQKLLWFKLEIVYD